MDREQVIWLYSGPTTIHASTTEQIGCVCTGPYTCSMSPFLLPLILNEVVFEQKIGEKKFGKHWTKQFLRFLPEEEACVSSFKEIPHYLQFD